LNEEKTMKAIRLHAYAGPLALEEIPAPAITDDDVLVKIRSTAVNHLDLA
jgi:NADPH:quinone reductase-like Zn-dependent oxidoreductase